MSFSGSGGGAASRKNAVVKKGEKYEVGLDYRYGGDQVELTWGDKGKSSRTPAIGSAWSSF